MVNEVKRMGKVVYVASFYESGLNPSLRMASDECFGIDTFFCDQWRKAGSDSGKAAGVAEPSAAAGAS
jgi:hypothetical protein